MNRNKLKTYAPKARRDFIAAVTARATKFGITKNAVEPVQVQGNVAVIAGQAHPKKVAEQRAKLEARIKTRGFEQVMEEAAYTWFNRFAAIRYMEVHGYLDHGYRVLSHPEGKATPEIVEHAQHLDLPGLDREKVIELKLDGTKEGELYRMLLVAQCNALHAAMPFLFERIDDETELLLPDNLLHSDSVIRQMVTEIDEEDWQEIEIIGWLYQFYISEKKDQVIGKVVKSEDIPAATQLFTPNWIVKYMVQNTLGAKWLATYPQSGIRAKMEYYIEPAEQTEDVKAKLAEITPRELNPEEITFLDPACGSGHILVEAYDLFKEIYLERGYVLRDVPRLILEKNLFGLDIDDRAAQMAAFALLMKARADDRRIFNNTLIMNITSLEDVPDSDATAVLRKVSSAGIYMNKNNDLLPETISQGSLNSLDADRKVVTAFFDLFRLAKNFGSLIRIEKDAVKSVGAIAEPIIQRADGLLSDRDTANRVGRVLRQAELLSRKFTCVAANPPYMGSGNFNNELKSFAKHNYKKSCADLYGCFIERCGEFLDVAGFCAMLTIPNWMSSSSFAGMRGNLFSARIMSSFLYIGRGAFGSDFGTCAFSFRNCSIGDYRGAYRKLFGRRGSVSSNAALSEAARSAATHVISQNEQLAIPGAVIAFWFKKSFLSLFGGKTLEKYAKPVVGLQTGKNPQFIRYWWEVSLKKIGFNTPTREEGKKSGAKWFPYTKGGDFRRWYGNNLFVVDWEGDGSRIRANESSVIRNSDYYFSEGGTYTNISISNFAGRYSPQGFLFDQKGSMFFAKNGDDLRYALALLNSGVGDYFFDAFCPTMDFNPGSLSKLPVIEAIAKSAVVKNTNFLIEAEKLRWDSRELSWDFAAHPLIRLGKDRSAESFEIWSESVQQLRVKSERLEAENDAIIGEAYGLSGELRAIASGAGDESHLQGTICDLMSYAIGCMMGRYSLDDDGLIYADSGSLGFELSRYITFPADEDGIVPIMQTDWFDDDAANRFVEFVKVAWSPDTQAENLKFVAANLGSKTGETPIDTIRRYLSADFFKDHLKTYKKRPIYWLFSSGKEKAFEALVYLHRYNEGTLSRMRMEYVTPLQGRISARIDQLGRDIDAAPSTAAQNKLRKEQEKLKKQQAELIKFDEQLRHYADMRIKLDLDDGVKVNYGKFGTLLAEVKAITGGSDE